MTTIPPEASEGVPVLIDGDQHHDRDAEPLERPEPRSQRVIEDQVRETEQEHHRHDQERVREQVRQREQPRALGDGTHEVERGERRGGGGDQPEVEVRPEVAAGREHEEVQESLAAEGADEEHLVPGGAARDLARVRHHRGRLAERETEPRGRRPPVEAHVRATVVAHRERVAAGRGQREVAEARSERKRGLGRAGRRPRVAPAALAPAGGGSRPKLKSSSPSRKSCAAPRRSR